MMAMMIKLDGTKIDGDIWPDLRDKAVIHLGGDAPALQVAVLARGTRKGHPSIAFRFELPDGQTVIAETTAKLFLSCALAIETKYPGLIERE